MGLRTCVAAGSGTAHSTSGVPSARVKTPEGVTHGAMGQISAPSDRCFAVWIAACTAG